MFLLGVFGSSYKKRMLREVKNKVEFDRLVEKEKNK
jgi:hypothetical protein|tara:strand:- start:17 stop:124 length:108 start_codon:yes stop_codon:yes gene_type:complete